MLLVTYHLEWWSVVRNAVVRYVDQIGILRRRAFERGGVDLAWVEVEDYW